MNKRTAETILASAKHCKEILTLRRNELVAKDLHDRTIDVVCDALGHWEEIEEQYKEYLK